MYSNKQLENDMYNEPKLTGFLAQFDFLNA